MQCLTGSLPKVSLEMMDLESLKSSLVGNEEFLLRLLENPMVFEHESFTDLLLSLHHLTEELRARDYLCNLPAPDCAHLENDMQRVYGMQIPEWIRHVNCLRQNYPYLFSLAM